MPERRSQRSIGGLTRRQVLGAALGAAALGAVGFRPRTADAAQPPIRIGFCVPLTGPYGSEAQDQVRCAELAVREFNASGGLNGRKAELLVRDSKLSPDEAATRTLELIENEHVDFVAGSLSASVQLAVNNITKQHRILYNSISQSDAINEPKDFSRYTFHEALNPTMTTDAVGRYAFPRFGKRVVFLLPDYAYGHEMTRGFKRVGKEFGIEVLSEIRHPLGTTDFSVFFPRIRALKPDVLVCCNFGRDQQITLKQATDFGLKRAMKIVYPILLYTARLAVGPRAYQGVVGGTSYYWGLEKTVPAAKQFNDRYRAAYGGRVPSDYGAFGYAGVRTILASVRQAGSVETDAVIRRMEALHYDFYKGPEYYRACDHQAVQSVLIVESKPAPADNQFDVFKILEVYGPNRVHLRSCRELGYS